MDSIDVLIVGSEQDAAQSACTAALAELSMRAGVEHVPDLRAAARRLADQSAKFDLIALAEPRPGHYSNDEVDALRRIAPVARVWRLLGSWCEGEQRSGRPPTGCTSTYWHRLPAQLSREFQAVREERCPTWGLPLTATPDEVFAAAMTQPVARGSGLIVVCAAAAEAAGALADACRGGGYETRKVLGGTFDFEIADAAAVVWDTPIERAADPRQVARVKQAAGGAPVLVVAGFPRTHATRGAIDAGVADVVSKPFLVCDLLWHVDRAVRARR